MVFLSDRHRFQSRPPAPFSVGPHTKAATPAGWLPEGWLPVDLERVFLSRLKDVRQELVTPMIPLRGWVVVVPAFIVNWDSHFGWVPMVHAIGASVILIAPVIVRVGYIGVMVEAVHVSGAVLASPLGTVSSLAASGMSKSHGLLRLGGCSWHQA